MNWWMRKWAYEHPDIVDLKQVGTSFGGKPIYQLTITNKALRRRRPTSRPRTSTAAATRVRSPPPRRSLYLAWKLITRLRQRPRHHAHGQRQGDLHPAELPTRTAASMYRQTAQTNRSSIRPTDNNGNGLLDDAVAEGPQRRRLHHADPPQRRRRQRQLHRRRARPDRPHDAPRPERRGQLRPPEREPRQPTRIGGLDLHRNYPYNWRPMPGQDATGRGWTQGGAGEYPLSEPEIRSTHGFLIRQPEHRRRQLDGHARPTWSCAGRRRATTRSA